MCACVNSFNVLRGYTSGTVHPVHFRPSVDVVFWVNRIRKRHQQEELCLHRRRRHHHHRRQQKKEEERILGKKGSPIPHCNEVYSSVVDVFQCLFHHHHHHTRTCFGLIRFRFFFFSFIFLPIPLYSVQYTLIQFLFYSLQLFFATV